MAPKVVLQTDFCIGRGGYSQVFQAVECKSSRLVALKKSRVSLRVKRSLLQHEAHVLRLLLGHPTVPEVYGYGRIPHFELLSMQRLKRSLSETVQDQGSFSSSRVLDLADQLLSGLEHIHSHGIVHRDIKPDNVLFAKELSESLQICIIDFGLAYRPPKSRPAPGVQDVVSLFGTPAYASLNAHSGIDLTPRDDLESLMYTLRYVASGDLPWMPCIHHGTARGALRQIAEQKKKHDGARWKTDGLPSALGDCLDYARALKYDQVPDYDLWRRRFRECAGEKRPETVAANDSADQSQSKSADPPSPFTVGQVVRVRVAAQPTIEGHSTQISLGPSYMHDPSLSCPEWSNPQRLAVVLEVGREAQTGLHTFVAVSIGAGGSDGPKLPIVGSGASPPSGSSVSTTPAWPLDDSCCYVFQRPFHFICVPSNPVVPTGWAIDASGVALLQAKLTPPRDPFFQSSASRSADPDVRWSARVHGYGTRIFAEVSTVSPTSTTVDELRDAVHSDVVHRSWFDEAAKALRRRARDEGRPWSEDATSSSSDGEELDDSYYGVDFEEWENRQGERPTDLTVGSTSAHARVGGEERIPDLYEIELKTTAPDSRNRNDTSSS